MDEIDYSQENDVVKRYDPSDMSYWQDMPADEFILMIVHDLMPVHSRIEGFAKLLEESVDPDRIIVEDGEASFRVGDSIERILQEIGVLKHLVLATNAYGVMLKDKKE